MRRAVWIGSVAALCLLTIPASVSAQTYTGAFETVGEWGGGTSCVYRFRRVFTDVTLELGSTSGFLSGRHQSFTGPLITGISGCSTTVFASEITDYGFPVTVTRSDGSATFTSGDRSQFTLIEGSASPAAATGTWSERAGIGLFSSGDFTLTSGPTEPCTYDVVPTSAIFPAAGGGGSINVTTQDGCEWSASSGADWIEVTSSTSGVGSGSIAYSITENPEMLRTGTLTVAETAVSVTQAGEQDEEDPEEPGEGELVLSVSPDGLLPDIPDDSIPPLGGLAFVSVTGATAGVTVNFVLEAVTLVGHSHAVTDALRSALQTLFIQDAQTRAASCVADQEGACHVLLQAPPISGSYAISASAAGGTGTATFDVFVDGLQELPSSGPFHSTASGDSNHPSFRWGQPDLVASQTGGILCFAELYWNLSGHFALSFNDLSLPLGGQFDSQSQWQVTASGWVSPPQRHQFHRGGTSVDLNRTTTHTETGATQTITDTDRLLNQTALACGMLRLPEGGPIHFDLLP